MTDSAAVHPLRAAGFGEGPFRLWTDIYLPKLAVARGDPALMERRRRRIATDSRLFHVALDECALCHAVEDIYYVVVDRTGLKSTALCRPCLEGTGDLALHIRAKQFDRMNRKLLDELAPKLKRRTGR